MSATAACHAALFWQQREAGWERSVSEQVACRRHEFFPVKPLIPSSLLQLKSAGKRSQEQK